MAGHFGGNPYKWDYPAGVNNPHVTRYFLAKGFIFPWETVLDAACATGYGSKLMAKNCKKVIGMEIDEGCVNVANGNKPENCEFVCADLDKAELPDVDVAVTIETVEHLNDMHHFVNQLHKHVKRCIIITVPIGGTSFAYVNEPPSPATEKNDFGSGSDVDKLIAPEGSEWKHFNSFTYGYSYFAIYFKGQPEVPEGWPPLS